MSNDGLLLAAYFGERDRANGRLLADALLDVLEGHRFGTAVLLRGVEGFGLKHHLQSADLLSLSEDLPIVALAIDRRDRVEAALGELTDLGEHGLFTLERVALGATPPEGEDEAKLTAYLGRGERVGGRPAHIAVVDALRDRGVGGATVLLGVDGVLRGERRRARFFAGNGLVPAMVVAVGPHDAIAAAIADLERLAPQAPHTIERVTVCRRDGARLRDPAPVPSADAQGLDLWQKLTVFAGEQSQHRGQPLHPQLIRRLREAGAMGATTIRGVWGFHGDHEPHGDSIWSIRRRVPTVTTVIDRAERCRAWLELIAEITDETGLVTSELVPGLRAGAPGVQEGSLRLARPPRPEP